MTLTLNSLKDTVYKRKKKKRVGRGDGSGMGQTCGRGRKGAGARAGHTHRHTYEGGQFRLFMKLPIRGFTRGRFKKPLDVINLAQIEKAFSDGEVVNKETLKQKGFFKGRGRGVFSLGRGHLTGTCGRVRVR